ncbi:hypothetical protein MOKP38_46320 [Mycobacterium avium subsp. hominissuis]
MRNRTLSRPLIAAGIAAVMLSGCGTVTEGEPVASEELTISTTTSTVPPRTPTLRTTTQAPDYIPESPYQIVDRLKAFWLTKKVDLRDVIPEEDPALICNGKTLAEGDARALYCDGGEPDGRPPLPDYLKWKPALVSGMSDPVLGTAAHITLAHEMGHAMQDWTGRVEGDTGTPTSPSELSADCLAGFYVSQTGLDRELVEEALPHTRIGDSRQRIEAFEKGMSLPASKGTTCLKAYEQ